MHSDHVCHTWHVHRIKSSSCHHCSVAQRCVRYGQQPTMNMLAQVRPANQTHESLHTASAELGVGAGEDDEVGGDAAAVGEDADEDDAGVDVPEDVNGALARSPAGATPTPGCGAKAC